MAAFLPVPVNTRRTTDTLSWTNYGQMVPHGRWQRSTQATGTMPNRPGSSSQNTVAAPRTPPCIRDLPMSRTTGANLTVVFSGTLLRASAKAEWP